MVGLRAFALVRSADQWARATHDETTLDLTEGVVELAAERALPAQTPAEGPELAGGLAFDRGCRAYRSVPDEAYEAVCRHFSQDEVIALSVAIANINAWNRLGAAFRFAPPIQKKVAAAAS